MLERLSKTHRNLALAAVAVLLAWFAWTVRSVLNPLVLGYLLAYILRPMVQRLQDRGMGRRRSVNIIFVTFGLLMLLVFGATFVQGKQFIENQIVHVQEGDDLFTRAQKNIDKLLGLGGAWVEKNLQSDAAEELEGGSAEAEPEQTGEPEQSGEPEQTGMQGPEPDPEGAPAEDPREGEEGDGAVLDSPESQEQALRDVASAGQTPARIDLTQELAQVKDDLARVRPPVVTEAGGESDPSEVIKQGGKDNELTLRNLVKAWSKSLVGSSDGSVSGLDRAQVVLGYLQRIFGGMMSVLGFLALLPVYTYFLLFELERIHDFMRAHIPKQERERVTRIGRRVGSVIANFFRGRLLICLLKGLVLAIGLTILQVPYGFLLGVVSGFLSLVPFVGPMIGFGLTFLMSLQKASPDGSGMWLSLALLGGVFALAEIVEGYVLIPKILGDTLGLHPVVILLSVFVGGASLGLFGFLIAIPLAATLIILFRELVMPALADFAEEDSHVDTPGPGAEKGTT